MLLALALTLVGVVRATECGKAELDAIFFEFQPAEVNFGSDIASSCTNARNRIDLFDNYSPNFLSDFCACAVYTNPDKIAQKGLTCTINGQTPYKLAKACQEMSCESVSPLGQCTCEASKAVDFIPPSDAQLVTPIRNACMAQYNSLNTQSPQYDAVTPSTCSCFYGYDPIKQAGEYPGCAFDVSGSVSYANAMKFHGLWDACKVYNECKACFTDDGTDYDVTTQTCLTRTEASVSACPASSVLGCVSSPDNCMAPSKLFALDTCEVCTANSKAWSEALGLCVETCPAGDSCTFVASNCETSCDPPCQNGGSCRNRVCVCDGSGYGPSCETERKEMVITAEDSKMVNPTDLTYVFTVTAGAMAGATYSSTGRGATFNYVMGDTGEIDVQNTNKQICYFYVDTTNRKTVPIDGYGWTAADQRCVAAEVLRFTLTKSDVTAAQFTPYMNQDLIDALAEAMADLGFTANKIEDLNIEAADISQSGDDITFDYYISGDAVNAVTAGLTDEVQDGDGRYSSATLNAALTTKFSQQPHLSSLWKSSLFSLEFSLFGIASLDPAALKTVLATLGHVSESSVTMTIRPIANTADGNVINVQYSSTEEKINTIIAEVDSGVFQTGLQNALASNSAFN
jgi:hypothetical protein